MGQGWEFAIAMACTGIPTKVQNKAEHVGDKVGFQWQINRQGEKELGKVL